ncbi:MAG: alpha/beta fold hydrolase, partial [Candidatus Omnitrophica bacterium]|nr:alpha/beta fold hydrolase [Candidatus Omnitrophota bacterium]
IERVSDELRTLGVTDKQISQAIAKAVEAYPGRRSGPFLVPDGSQDCFYSLFSRSDGEFWFGISKGDGPDLAHGKATIDRSELRSVKTAHAVSEREGVERWVKAIARKLDRYDDPIQAWDKYLRWVLMYLVGMTESSNESVQAKMLGQPELDLEHLKAPELIGSQQLEEIGNQLRTYWNKRGWNESAGRIDLWISSLGDYGVGFVPVGDFDQIEERIDFLTHGGSFEGRLLVEWVKGVGLVSHLRYYGPHIEKEGVRPVDNELLVKTVREFIPKVLVLSRIHEFKLPPPTANYQGKRPKFTFRDLMLWGLSVMLDPTIHDMRFGLIAEEGNGYHTPLFAREFWPKGATQSIPDHLLRMFTDLYHVDSKGKPTSQSISREEIEELLAEVLVKSETNQNGRSWFINRGLRPPRTLVAQTLLMYGLTYNPFSGSIIHDILKSPERAFRDPFLMLALPDRELSKSARERLKQYRTRLNSKSTRERFDALYPNPAKFQQEVFLGWKPFQKVFPGLRARMERMRSELRAEKRKLIGSAARLSEVELRKFSTIWQSAPKKLRKLFPETTDLDKIATGGKLPEDKSRLAHLFALKEAYHHVYPRASGPNSTPPLEGAEPITLPVKSGRLMTGWLLEASDKKETKHPTVVLMAPWGLESRWLVRAVQALRSELPPSFNFLLLNHYAHGESNERFNSAGILESEDLPSAMEEFSKREGVDRTKLIAVGFSYGAIAFSLAQAKANSPIFSGIAPIGMPSFYVSAVRNFFKTFILSFYRLSRPDPKTLPDMRTALEEGEDYFVEAFIKILTDGLARRGVTFPDHDQLQAEIIDGLKRAPFFFALEDDEGVVDKTQRDFFERELTKANHPAFSVYKGKHNRILEGPDRERLIADLVRFIQAATRSELRIKNTQEPFEIDFKRWFEPYDGQPDWQKDRRRLLKKLFYETSLLREVVFHHFPSKTFADIEKLSFLRKLGEGDHRQTFSLKLELKDGSEINLAMKLSKGTSLKKRLHQAVGMRTRRVSNLTTAGFGVWELENGDTVFLRQFREGETFVDFFPKHPQETNDRVAVKVFRRLLQIWEATGSIITDPHIGNIGIFWNEDIEDWDASILDLGFMVVKPDLLPKFQRNGRVQFLDKDGESVADIYQPVDINQLVRYFIEKFSEPANQMDDHNPDGHLVYFRFSFKLITQAILEHFPPHEAFQYLDQLADQSASRRAEIEHALTELGVDRERLLGASSVLGVDFGERGVEDAKRQAVLQQFFQTSPALRSVLFQRNRSASVQDIKGVRFVQKILSEPMWDWYQLELLLHDGKPPIPFTMRLDRRDYPEGRLRNAIDLKTRKLARMRVRPFGVWELDDKSTALLIEYEPAARFSDFVNQFDEETTKQVALQLFKHLFSIWIATGSVPMDLSQDQVEVFRDPKTNEWDIFITDLGGMAVKKGLTPEFIGNGRVVLNNQDGQEVSNAYQAIPIGEWMQTFLKRFDMVGIKDVLKAIHEHFPPEQADEYQKQIETQTSQPSQGLTTPFVNQKLFHFSIDKIDEQLISRISPEDDMIIVHDNDGDGIASAELLKAMLLTIKKTSADHIHLVIGRNPGVQKIIQQFEITHGASRIFVIFTDLGGALSTYEQEVPREIREKVTSVISIDHHHSNGKPTGGLDVHPRRTWQTSVKADLFPSAVMSFYIALELIRRYQGEQAATVFFEKYLPFAVLALRHDAALNDGLGEWNQLVERAQEFGYPIRQYLELLVELLQLDASLELKENLYEFWLGLIGKSLTQASTDWDVHRAYQSAAISLKRRLSLYEGDLNQVSNLVEILKPRIIDENQSGDDAIVTVVTQDDLHGLKLTHGIPRVRFRLSRELNSRFEELEDPKPPAIFVLEQDSQNPNQYHARFRAIRDRVEVHEVAKQLNLGAGNRRFANGFVVLGRTINPYTNQPYQSISELIDAFHRKIAELGASPVFHRAKRAREFMSNEEVRTRARVIHERTGVDPFIALRFAAGDGMPGARGSEWARQDERERLQEPEKWLGQNFPELPEIHSEEIGTGNEPSLVLIHGMDQNMETWRRHVTNALSKNHRLILVDLRGHGKSPWLGMGEQEEIRPLQYQIDLLAADIKRMLDRRGEKQVTVVGHSLGGRVALSFAAQFPEMVNGIFVEDMGFKRASQGERADRIIRNAERLKQEFGSQPTFDEKESAQRFVNQFVAVRLGRKDDERFIDEAFPKVMTRLPAGEYQSVFHPAIGYLVNYFSWRSVDMTDALLLARYFGIPLKVIAAESQNFIRLPFGAREAKHLEIHYPKTQVVYVPETGHSIHRDRPEEFIRLVEEFLAENTNRSSPHKTIGFGGRAVLAYDRSKGGSDFFADREKSRAVLEPIGLKPGSPEQTEALVSKIWLLLKLYEEDTPLIDRHSKSIHWENIPPILRQELKRMVSEPRLHELTPAIIEFNEKVEKSSARSELRSVIPPARLNSDKGPDGKQTWPQEVIARYAKSQIQDLIRDNQFSPDSKEYQKLIQLRNEMLNGSSIQLLPEDGTPGHHEWNLRMKPYVQGGWFGDIPFGLSESYFYRRVLHATGFFDPDQIGYRRDPYATQKSLEMTDVLQTFPAQIQAIDELTDGKSKREAQAITLSYIFDGILSGNKFDLTLSISKGIQLLRDEREKLIEFILSKPKQQIDLVIDNTGNELLYELFLAAYLLNEGFAEQVRIHAKPHPYFMSDSTLTDTLETIEKLKTHSDQTLSRLGHSLDAWLREGKLQFWANDFWTTGRAFSKMPEILLEAFESSGLVIFVGDLNYRRLIGERHWPIEDTFQSRVAYFSAPLVALRMIKFDLAVGLPPNVVAALNQKNPRWWHEGTHGLIQAGNLPTEFSRSELRYLESIPLHQSKRTSVLGDSGAALLASNSNKVAKRTVGPQAAPNELAPRAELRSGTFQERFVKLIWNGVGAFGKRRMNHAKRLIAKFAKVPGMGRLLSRLYYAFYELKDMPRVDDILAELVVAEYLESFVGAQVIGLDIVGMQEVDVVLQVRGSEGQDNLWKEGIYLVEIKRARQGKGKVTVEKSLSDQIPKYKKLAENLRKKGVNVKGIVLAVIGRGFERVVLNDLSEMNAKREGVDEDITYRIMEIPFRGIGEDSEENVPLPDNETILRWNKKGQPRHMDKLFGLVASSTQSIGNVGDSGGHRTKDLKWYEVATIKELIRALRDMGVPRNSLDQVRVALQHLPLAVDEKLEIKGLSKGGSSGKFMVKVQRSNKDSTWDVQLMGATRNVLNRWHLTLNDQPPEVVRAELRSLPIRPTTAPTYIEAIARAELRSESLPLQTDDSGRFFLSDKVLFATVRELLERKKADGLRRNEANSKATPYVHFPYILVGDVARALGIQERVVIYYLKHHQKKPEDFGMYQSRKVLTQERVRWAATEIRKLKEERITHLSQREKRKRHGVPITVWPAEVGQVFSLGGRAIQKIIDRNPVGDNYGIAIKETVDHAERRKILKEIIDRLKTAQEEIILNDLVEPSGLSINVLRQMNAELFKMGVSPGGPGTRGLLIRFKEMLKQLSLEARTDLISFILQMHDQTMISSSQAYALIHLIRYVNTPFDSYKKIQEILGVSQPSYISVILQGVESQVSRSGALYAIEDQPEVNAYLTFGIPIPQGSLKRLEHLLISRNGRMPAFRAKLDKSKDEDEPKRVELNAEQKAQISIEALKGVTRKEIGRRFPKIVGDARFEPVNAATITTFLNREEHTREVRGAVPTLLQVLEDEQILRAQSFDPPALSASISKNDSRYRIAANRIMRVIHLENPADILSTIKSFERITKTPFAKLVEALSNYITGKQYPFDVKALFYSTLVGEGRISDIELAEEVASYFSSYVMLATAEPVAFIDSLIYMLQPSRSHYYLDVNESVQFVANVYFAIKRKDHQKEYLAALSSLAHGDILGLHRRQPFAAFIYREALKVIFPRLKFLSMEEIEKATKALRREVILADEAKRYDVNYILEKVYERERERKKAEQLISELIKKSSFEAIAKKWRIREQDFNLVNDAVFDAAW